MFNFYWYFNYLQLKHIVPLHDVNPDQKKEHRDAQCYQVFIIVLIVKLREFETDLKIGSQYESSISSEIKKVQEIIFLLFVFDRVLDRNQMC